jgi:hypothetical protein
MEEDTVRPILLTLSVCVAVAATVVWYVHEWKSGSDGTIVPGRLSELGGFIDFEVEDLDEYRYSDPFDARPFMVKIDPYDDVEGY